MKTIANIQRDTSIKIVINGKSVSLFFSPQPNYEAADYIKKSLMNGYTLKAI